MGSSATVGPLGRRRFVLSCRQKVQAVWRTAPLIADGDLRAQHLRDRHPDRLRACVALAAIYQGVRLAFLFDEDLGSGLGDFGALPFIYGTVLSSLLAVCMAVPLALATSIFLLDICPKFLRAPISFLTELLAAIPSVVYGLWGVFVLVAIIRDQAGPVLEKILLDWVLC